MSLAVDGVWSAGVWATTVWESGVWREGGVGAGVANRCALLVGDGSFLAVDASGALALSEEICASTNPSTSGGTGRVFPFPRDKKKRSRVEHQPLPEYEVSGPLSRDRKLENFRPPDWDQEAWEAGLKTLRFLEAEERETKKRKAVSFAALLLLD